MGRPTAARACRLPMRAAGGWGAPAFMERRFLKLEHKKAIEDDFLAVVLTRGIPERQSRLAFNLRDEGYVEAVLRLALAHHYEARMRTEVLVAIRSNPYHVASGWQMQLVPALRV